MPAEPVYLVTGATSGVGLEAASILAATGATVLAHARSTRRGEPVVERLRREHRTDHVHLVCADLARLGEVRALAERVAAAWPVLHGLVNNAGLARDHRVVTEDGFELTMQVNHLSHFLLTLLLLPALRRGRARVVNVSSKGHRGARLAPGSVAAALRGEGRYNGWLAYANSKLANILFTRELARRESEAGLTAFAVHPGVLATGIWNRNRRPTWMLARLFKPLMGPPRIGGDATARLVLDPESAAWSGAYFEELERADPHLPPHADALAVELWDESLRAVGE